MNQHTNSGAGRRRKAEIQACTLAVAALLAAYGCTARGDVNPSGLSPATTAAQTQAPATPVQEESPPPRWVQPNETRAPETERPAPTTATTVPAPSVTRPPTTITPKPSASATKAPSKAQTPPAQTKPAATAPAPTRTTTKPVAPTTRPVAPTPVTKPRGNTITIGTWTHGYVSDYGSQASLDRCNLVEWESGWFAGHDYCGYAFWASLRKGQTITLTGPHAGTYTVTATVYLPTQGGKKPALPAYDIVLQTCKGSGTQLILARKTG